MNDQLGTINGVAGGLQAIYTAGLNWCVNGNIRFMFDYLHGNIAKQISPTNSGDAGARFDAFAMRAQVAFWIAGQRRKGGAPERRVTL